MPTFPGHRYLGPGNPILNGQPVDIDDAIAQRHDWDYEHATKPEDIRSADRVAIRDFFFNYKSTRNWHSYIGAIGLTLKYGAESILGVQYPKIDNRKRPGGDPNVESPKKGKTDSDQSPSKPSGSGMSGSKTSVEPMDTLADVGPGAEGQAESRSGGNANTSGGHQINIIRPIGDFKKGKLVFVHSRLLSSKGFQYKVLQSSHKIGKNNHNVLCTPFARIPCDVIPWYLMTSEFNNLPLNSTVKYCETIVKPMGFRTPFVTGSSKMGSVNSALFVIGCHAYGLNNTIGGKNYRYTINADNPCVINTISTENEDDWPRWWGEKCASDKVERTIDIQLMLTTHV
uniref:Phospholipase A2-like domain-containing protein n=1 Tax=Clastoptera arizonana TaxID=38151 RepID=A0A1B6CH90_9HEMI